MEQVGLRRFSRTLAGLRRIGLDTPVLIYHLEDVAPYSELTTHLLAAAATGTLQVLFSVVTMSEVLVGAWKTGTRDRAGRIESALRALPGVRFADITVDVAGKAAEVRGRTGLALPDSLIIASIVHQGAQAVVTNDRRWRTKRMPCRVFVLDDFVESSR